MNVARTITAVALTAATLSTLAACATASPAPAAQSGAPSPRSNTNVLTAAEIATAPGITNAQEAIQTLRPQFLRTRNSAARPAGMLGAGAEGAMSGRRPGEQPPAGGGGVGGGDPSEGQNSGNLGGRRAPEDVGILVYVDKQRYGQVTSLREIPVTQIAEIRFLNAGEANSQFGMGHPHGVIQIVTKTGPR